MGKEPTQERAKEQEEDRAQVLLRLGLESLVVVLMVAIVVGGVVSLGRHMVVTETHRTHPQATYGTHPQTAGRLDDLCAVLATHKGKVIEVDSLKRNQGLGGGEGVHCEGRYRTVGGSTRVPGGGH